MHELVSQIIKNHRADPANFRADPSAGAAVLNGSVPGMHAVRLWQEIRAQFPATGLWPVLRGDGGDDIETYPYDAAETLRKVPGGRIDQILAAPRLAERIETYQEFIKGLSPDVDLPAFIAKVDASGAMSFGGAVAEIQPWPIEEPPQTLEDVHSVTNIRSRKPFDSVRLSLIGLKHPYEAPAYLGFGGWNDAPFPELQVAALREWQSSHGAVPLAITGDVMECFVERPPQTEAEAMSLAGDQWIFCDDIVGQGTQSVRNLAIELWRSPKWFFWWD